MKRKKLLVVGSIPDESNLLNYGGGDGVDEKLS